MNNEKRQVAAHPPVTSQPQSPKLGTNHPPLPVGVLCVNLGNLGARLSPLKAMLEHDPVVLAVIKSPSGDVLKVLVRAPAALARPKQAFLSAATHFERKYGAVINDDFNCCGEENR